MHDMQPTDNIHFIHRCEVPLGKKATYVSHACDFMSLKEENFRVIITVRGDKIVCEENYGLPATNLI